MPYISIADRKVIDAALEPLAHKAANEITNNLSLIKVYEEIFITVAEWLRDLLREGSDFKRIIADTPEKGLAKAICEVNSKYDYEGAYLGELNYAITRLIQRVPGILVEQGKWEQEFRYWIYARTVSALIYASRHTEELGIGIEGVFEDVKDEYKRRVNAAYEAEQIVKSGDCYDTPYYTKLVKLTDDNGKPVGYVTVDLKRDPKTVKQDVLDGTIVLRGDS